MGQYESNSFDLPLLFLCTSVNTTSYADMLEMWLIPWPSHGNCVDAAWWSTCTFCPHYVSHSEWISFKPLEWPWFTNISHTDLTMPDNSVWGIKKEHVAGHHSLCKLYKAVEHVFAAIMTYMIWSMSQRVWQHTWLYFEHNGAHIYQIHLMYCGSPSDK